MNKFYKPQAQQKRIRINEYIRVPEVLVIDENGQKIGVLPIQEALRLAHERGLDLLEIAPTAKPPVCKIIDYGKYQYQQERMARQQKSKTKKVEVKGIRLTFRISDHDMEVRATQADKFLKEGNKVRIELVLRGREKALKDFAKERMKKFISLIQSPFQIDQPQKFLPSGISTIITPGKK
ncbi:MAG: Translation initiation factor IF-3 [Parcubacteria group bacterium GW2011_GWD2_38_12]|uniref:Translation initiation factor IF-3 n=1 Tax=Candidatus Azambacteria bacterium RIFCSPLOWO2_01_FULL_37_9 TaxID=1797297 RepID=A0A1F5C886_9BACT|nr:MAG: Translation initiation factor IF-3 [Parcubacteria group bacterium GW2011_GWC2_36_17]KKQ40549.1 MAG: Translation initiation factor IF-3 [Candidatus Moranbacteria bacterium GW2011_GWF2_37_7]KKQ43332.1 MAG: Translation initiation factor IF-3 [Parcubacteria group bacterium GW2011_GWE2_37_8]KKQ51051.1 MAG: Translation initiation factor IF-3 [Parcubacteria group bacterium GW2011_GWD2_38_12]KKQ58153.1 MAG: Translation initiation factor IF-3 [Parcubacteria group bacterium GW2011_GWC1_38_17]KKQ